MSIFIVSLYIFKWSWIFILKWLVLNISDPTRKFATWCFHICKKCNISLANISTKMSHRIEMNYYLHLKIWNAKFNIWKLYREVGWMNNTWSIIKNLRGERTFKSFEIFWIILSIVYDKRHRKLSWNRYELPEQISRKIA